MGKHERTLAAVLRGASDANIPFHDLRGLLLHLGFEERVRGSLHLYRREGVEEKLNLQRAGNKAKPYQVKQVRDLLLRHRLTGE